MSAMTAGIVYAPTLPALVHRILARRLATALTPESLFREIFDDTGAPSEEAMAEDVPRYVERDFTASTPLDVLLFSNGFHALATHRISSTLFAGGREDDARLLAGIATKVFGAELHPAAKIGQRVFLDHGQGVVIGETATIGDDCAIFQGVTLGSTAKTDGKRHPTLLAGVIVGAGAKIIGAVTVGAGAVIGPNAVVTEDVEAGARLR